MTTQPPRPGMLSSSPLPAEAQQAASPSPAWVPSYELYQAAHHWQQIMLFCLAGSLIGLVLAVIWPSPYRATQELYVGLDMTNAPGEIQQQAAQGLQFANLNDYKNWQMANLNALILTDEILAETLRRLRQSDPAWEQANQQELAGMLKAYWRNAGKWHLVAEDSDAERAAQAVNTWQAVVVERVSVAVAAAQQLPLLQSQVQALNRERASLTGQAAALHYHVERLNHWLDDSASQSSDEILGRTERDFLAGLAASNPSLAVEFPPTDSVRGRYRKWARQALAVQEENLYRTGAQLAALTAAENEIQVESRAAGRVSLGLASGLLVQQISSAAPTVDALRPVGLMILIGAALGLAIWGFLWLTQIGRL